MKVADFNYHLPENLIAQHPVGKRDESRLLVLNRRTGAMEYTIFSNIVNYLKSGDVLVLNDTRVIPARLVGKKANTGGKVEILLLREEKGKWEALLKPAARLKVGTEIVFGGGEFSGRIIARSGNGRGMVQFFCGRDFREKLERYGLAPLPPYIKRNREILSRNPDLELVDRKRYQTVYAKYEGSIAAPTAGLHFTQKLLDRIKENGLAIASITLHVGLGTFQPIRAEEVGEHRMDPEFYEVSKSSASIINRAKEKGGRIVSVGTSTMRALETVAGEQGRVRARRGSTDLFIYPGYRFKVTDIFLTNLHLPRSTPLMLVSAFARRKLILKAYRMALEKKYRFYSYGDAMLII